MFVANIEVKQCIFSLGGMCSSSLFSEAPVLVSVVSGPQFGAHCYNHVSLIGGCLTMVKQESSSVWLNGQDRRDNVDEVGWYASRRR